jgi:hypothetical protein
MRGMKTMEKESKTNNLEKERAKKMNIVLVQVKAMQLQARYKMEMKGLEVKLVLTRLMLLIHFEIQEMLKSFGIKN